MEKKISELDSASIVNENDSLVLNQGSETKKVSISVFNSSLNIPTSIARLISPGPAQLADDIVGIDQLLVACFHPSEIDVIDPSIVNLMIRPVSTPVKLGVSYKVIMNDGVSYGLHDFSLNSLDWQQIASMNNTNECVHANVIDKTNDVIYKITAQLKHIENLADSDAENDVDNGKVYVLVERSYARPSIP